MSKFNIEYKSLFSTRIYNDDVELGVVIQITHYSDLSQEIKALATRNGTEMKLVPKSYREVIDSVKQKMLERISIIEAGYPYEE